MGEIIKIPSAAELRGIKPKGIKHENQIPDNDTLVSNHYKVEYSSLNPKEYATISLLVNNNYLSVIGDDLSISVRGNGVTGVKKRYPWKIYFGIEIDFHEIGYSLPIRVMVLFSSVLFTITRTKPPFLEPPAQMEFQSDEQHKILGYLCSTNGSKKNFIRPFLEQNLVQILLSTLINMS